MAHVIDTAAYLDTVAELLKNGQRAVPVPVSGVSMRPFLREGDTVFLDPLPEKLRPGDIILFTRPTGQYVLHRIAAVRKDGTLLMQGDAQQWQETVNDPARVCGIVSGANRKGKLVSPKDTVWKFYAVSWRLASPVRPVIFRAYGALKKIL